MDSLYSVMGWTVSPQNPKIEALALTVSVFRDRAFKEVFKVNWSHKGGALI